jgi:hypothetical protein
MSMPDLSLANREWAQAEKLFREKVDYWTRFVTPSDNVDVCRYQFHLAATQVEQGRPADAVQTLRQACEQVKKDFGAEHPRMNRALRKLAAALSLTGDADEAAAISKQAEALNRRIDA